MSSPDLAIIGGGLLGRLIAWRAARLGFRATLYDAHDRLGHGATAWVAGGMIAPQAEATEVEPDLIEKGRHSLKLWPAWISQLHGPVHYSDQGTLVVWHRSDNEEAKRFESLLKSKDPNAKYRRLGVQELAAQEPTLQGRFRNGLLLEEDAHIDNRQLLATLADALDDAGVQCQWHRPVADSEQIDASLVIDCRGRDAKSRWKDLRSVRGEIVRLHAPGVELRHMIRLLHPRCSVYLISRPGGHLVVGATSLESEDCSPVSVRGALELLSAAYAVLPELAEARILELNTSCRPALPNNRPAIRFDHTKRLLEVNGLYRHGFLLSPAIVEDLLAALPKLINSPSEGAHAALPQWLLPNSE